MKQRVALIEDERALAASYQDFLQRAGYSVAIYATAESAIKGIDGCHPDLILLDIGLGHDPEAGFELCRTLRARDALVPIVFLTARDEEVDVISGLRLGADDYLTKPFSMEELLARMKAILNRTQIKSKNVGQKVKVGAILYEPELRILHLSDGPKKLTTKENLLLRLLVKNQNELLDRQAALRAVWGDDNYFNGRSMDVYIAKLRKLLKEDSNIEIMNVHGIGFKLLVKQ